MYLENITANEERKIKHYTIFETNLHKNEILTICVYLLGMRIKRMQASY